MYVKMYVIVIICNSLVCHSSTCLTAPMALPRRRAPRRVHVGTGHAGGAAVQARFDDLGGCWGCGWWIIPPIPRKTIGKP